MTFLLNTKKSIFSHPKATFNGTTVTYSHMFRVCRTRAAYNVVHLFLVVLLGLCDNTVRTAVAVYATIIVPLGLCDNAVRTAVAVYGNIIVPLGLCNNTVRTAVAI